MSLLSASLDRRYLIIQIKEDRDGCQAVVPVHPTVLDLPSSVLTDESIAREALSVAKAQFETEVESYVEAIGRDGSINESLKIQKFLKVSYRWRFSFAPFREMLAMRWDFGDEQPYEIGIVPAVMVSNAIAAEESGKEQATIEQIEISSNVTIFYGNTATDDYVLWPREMMMEYETKRQLPLGIPRKVVRSEKGWMASVPVSALCSSYTLNVPQALLMRNWASDYHNRLLERAKSRILV